MRRGKLRGTLLATSSALALIIAIDQSAQAGPPPPPCAVNNTFAGLPNTTSINCISFNDGANHTGAVTNATNGTITATHAYPPVNPGTSTGISIFGKGTTLTGNVTNNGSITAPQYGISVGAGAHQTSSGNAPGAGASLVGSITNNGSISANLGIQVAGSTALGLSFVTGSITNAVSGTITSPSNGGIGVSQAFVGGSVINNGKLVDAVISISESTVAGSITNTGKITTVTESAGISVNNGGSVGGSITNSGSITAKVVGITVFPNGGASGTPSPETITGSVVNTTRPSIP